MRVCHIWQNFFPIETGGVERYILTLTDYLSKEYQNMHFVLLTDKSALPLRQAFQIPDLEKINSLEVHRLNAIFPSLLRKISYKTFHRSNELIDDYLTTNLCRVAANIHGIDKIDIFHVHGFWQPIYPKIGLTLSEHFHRPLVITLHGDSVNPNDRLSMPVRTPATLNILRCADVITTYSVATLNVLKELGLNQSRLVPNFVDPRLFKRPASRKNRSGKEVVMISRLSEPKDPLTPIRAFAQVKKEVPETSFKIVGYGPLYEYARRLVRNLQLEDVVKFFGMKSDVRKFLWNSDISIGTRGSYITTLEAWAAGLVVIAPDFGIMRELISNGENGLLVTPGNVDELASAILTLIKNDDLREKIVRNGAKTLKRHDVSRVASSIADIYRSLT